RMMPAAPAETPQRVLRDIVAALHGDVLDGVRHVLDGDPQEAVSDLLWGPCDLLGRGHYCRERRKLRSHDHGVERRIAPGPEYFRKPFGVKLADHHVAVRH